MIKRPHQRPEEIIAHAQQADPLVMYYVVLKDRELGLGEAMSVAGAATVECYEAYADAPAHAEVFEEWFRDSYRKVVLRATPEEFAAVGELDCVTASTRDAEVLRCLPPRRRSRSEAVLSQLKPFTDAKHAKTPRELPEFPMYYVIRRGVMKTMGKAMAQAGHASLMCVRYFAEEYADALAEWTERGRGGVVYAYDGDWEAVKARVDCTYVTDAGLTQVQPGTETVLVIPPTALPEDIAADMSVVD